MENLHNNISKGTVIEGTVTSKGDIRVEGKIVGTVTCDQKLVIGETGVIEGNIDARNAIISGEVKGEVLIRELLQLQQSGKIEGDIFTQKLSVQIGAMFSGNCQMGAHGKTNQGKGPSKVEDAPDFNSDAARAGRRAKVG